MKLSTDDLKHLSKEKPLNPVKVADFHVPETHSVGDIALNGSQIFERLHKFTLTFKNYSLEAAYNKEYGIWMRKQAALAYALGILVVFLHFYVDYTAPGLDLETSYILWAWRVQIAIIGLLVLCIIKTEFFLKHNQAIVTITSLYSGSCLIAMFEYVPETTAYIYFGGLIPLFHWSLFAGLRFINLLFCSISGLIAFNIMMAVVVGAPLSSLVIYNLYLLGAVTFACAGCYTLERTRRVAFLQTLRIDRARRVNESMALHDTLTKLPNRQMFERRLKTVLERVKKGHTTAAVFFIDLDHFKPVNDEYGHAIGDKVLKVISHRLSHCIRPKEDLLARIGGDEFLVLTEGLYQDQALCQFASRLLKEVARPVELTIDTGQSITCHLGASIGIALIGEGKQQSPALLIKQADLAMYQVKREGRHGYAFYDQQYSAMPA